MKPTIQTGRNTLVCYGRMMDVRFVMNNPYVVLLDNVLTNEECDNLIHQAQQHLGRSMTVDDQTGGMSVIQNRTSRGCFFLRDQTPLVQTIDALCADLTNWPVENGEGLQVVRYDTYEEYKDHYDWFDPNMSGPAMHMRRGGQRLATVIFYLSDVGAGGSTHFPFINLDVRPKRGSALFFSNVSDDLSVDRTTLHAGRPVVQGTKYIATKWLRERRYD